MQLSPAYPSDLPSGFDALPLSLDDLAMQRAWEVEGVRRGVERFREAEASKDTAETVGGRHLMRKVLPDLGHAIRIAQADGLDRIANASKGRPPVWAWYVGLLPPDVMAVLVLSHMASAYNGRASERNILGTPVVRVARDIASAIRLQADYGAWVSDERRRTKDSKDTGGAYFNLYEALRREAKRIDTRAVKTWWRKIGVMQSAQWPLEHRLQLGSFLIHLAVQQSRDLYVIETVYRASHGSITVLKTTPKAAEEYRAVQENAELGWAWTMPMLIPPAPWKRSPKQPQET